VEMCVCSNKKAGLKIEGGRALIRKNMIYSSEAEGCHISSNSMPRLEVDILQNLLNLIQELTI